MPQWRLGPRDGRQLPDLVVFDLDPGEGTTVVECARVAERLAELLAADGLRGYPRTSGGKGMQLYLPVTVSRPEQTSEFAKAIAERLARETPRLVTAVMAKARRRGKVFVDWSQNNPHKTTIASYSLRGRARPTVATPVTWDEVRGLPAAGGPGVHRGRPAGPDRRARRPDGRAARRAAAAAPSRLIGAAARWSRCPPDTPTWTARYPRAYAHRGWHLGELAGCENTLAAFRRAVAEGFGYLELDVHASRDGVPIVHHDALLGPHHRRLRAGRRAHRGRAGRACWCAAGSRCRGWSRC